MSLISQLYRKKENLSSKIHDKLKIRKNKSQSTSSERHIFQENKSKYSINILYRKRINNSIDNLKGSINKIKKINNKKNNNSENYLYKNLISLYPFYYLDYNDLKYNLNDIIYFSDDSTLYKGKYFHNDICIKEIKNINYLSEKELDIIQNEIDISLKLHHKNIINTLGYSFNSNYTKIFIISEYMKNKSLKSYIDSNKGNIHLKQKLLFIFEISLAIEYMHTRKYKILHRDIKSSNILLDDNLHCKLCDFGMSKYYKNENATKSKNEEGNNNSINNYQTNSQSTLFWMSPEYLCDGIINEKSDIYSFGILIWEIFMEETNPYKNININDYILGNKEIVYNKRPIINDENFKECPKIKELICLMWNNDYNKRPNIESILNLLEDLNNKYSFL
jgi:serine/threonine protein kinase